MIPLRQSTAGQEIPLGYFVSSTDGDTERTALTIANTDIKLWKHGATALANKNSGGATHISNGIMYAVLDATDSDTLGGLVVHVHVATALPVRVMCVVYPGPVFDALFGTAKLPVDAVLWAGTTIPAPSIAGTPKVDHVATAGSQYGAYITSGLILAYTGPTSVEITGNALIKKGATVRVVTGLGAVSEAVVRSHASGAAPGTPNLVLEGDGFPATLDGTSFYIAFAGPAVSALAIGADGGAFVSDESQPLDANIVEVNGAPVGGDGLATPWGPE